MNFTRREALALGVGAATGAMVPGWATAQAKLEILVAYYGALINTAPVAVGMERGDFTKPNLQVANVMSTIGGGTSIRNMVAGGLPYGIVGTSAALTAIREGIDVKIVNGVIRTMQDLLWVAMPKSNISSIKDLAGKKIGITTPKSVSETMAYWALEAAGMKGKAELVALGSVGAGLSALEQGGVDAALILEPLWSSRRDRYKVAFTLENLPAMMQMVGVATGDFMRKNPEQLRTIIAGWRSAVEFTYANPDDAAKLMSKRFGETTLPVNVAATAVKNMAAIKYWSRGEIDLEGLKMWVKGMERQGEWQGAADWSKMIDQSFLASDLRT